MRVLAPQAQYQPALMRASQSTVTEQALFQPVPPTEPELPAVPGSLSVLDSGITKTVAALGGAAVGYYAATTGGGFLARTAGVAAGLAAAPLLLPVVLPLALLGGLAGSRTSSAPGTMMTRLVGTTLVVGGIAMLAGPIAGWFVGGADLGPVASTLAGLGTAAGVHLLRNWNAESVRERHETAVKELNEAYQKELESYQQRMNEYRGGEAVKPIAIDQDEEFLIVGDVPLQLNH